MQQMTTKLETITPKIAQDYLKHNTINRPVRRHVVAHWVNLLLRGAYVRTHQGISFDVNGALSDGQHRLMAIVESGVTIEINVSRNVPVEAFAVTDVGAMRSTSDILRTSPVSTSIAKIIVKLLTGLQEKRQDLQVIALIIECFDPAIRELRSANRKVISNAVVRAAAAAQLTTSPENAAYILQTYRALINLDFNAMSPVAQHFYRQLESGISKRSDIDLFARALAVFDANKANVTKLQVDKDSLLLRQFRNNYDYLVA